MKKYGWLLLLLVVGTAAFLFPPMLLKIEDEKLIGKQRMESAEKVILTEEYDLSLTEKSRLWVSGTKIFLKDGKHYQWETIGEKALEEIGKLEQQEIVALEKEGLQCKAENVLLVVDEEDAGRSFILWEVWCSNNYGNITLYMDDETGKILEISQVDVVAYESDAPKSSSDDEKVMKVQKISYERAIEIAYGWGEYLGCTMNDLAADELEYGWLMVCEYEDETGITSYQLYINLDDVIFGTETMLF